MTGKPLQPVIRQEGAHPLVHSLPHFHTLIHNKMHELVDQNMLKRKHDITPLKGKRAGAAIYWGENKLPFWVAQRRAGRQEKMVLSVESRESVLGKKWPLLSQRCGLYNAHLCSPYLLLGRKLKCQTIGHFQSIWFWLLLLLPWFVLVCETLISSKADSWSGPAPRTWKKECRK